MKEGGRSDAERRKLPWALACGAAGAAVALLLAASGALAPLERAAHDARVRAFPARPPDAVPIHLLLIDQKSLDFYAQRLGSGWPWRRDVHSAIVDALQARGARLVAFDVLFTEPSETWPEDDEMLADATAHAGDVVHAFDARQEREDDRRAAERDDEVTARRAVAVSDASDVAWPQVNQLVPPFPALEAASAGIGCVRFAPDPDGPARSVEVLVQRGQALLPALPLALAELVVGAREVRVDGQRRLSLVPPEGARAPPPVVLDARGHLGVRFLGPAGTFPSSSAHALVNDWMLEQEGQAPQHDWRELSGAVVLVGASFTDLKKTPEPESMPGVELHANALANLLSGQCVVPPPAWAGPVAALVLALLVGLLLVMLSRPWIGAALAALLGVGHALAAGAAFARWGLMLPVALPVVAVAAAVVAGALGSYVLEGRQRRFLRRAFEHYLDREVIETLVKDPSRLRLGGDRREITVFFSDLQGFTTFSERLTPEELVETLNVYLTEMGRVIRDRGGTIDKYIGDAIMAFWGAPLPQPDHARRACLAAIGNQERLRVLGPELGRRAGVPLVARIGLNTGWAVVGNMGAEASFDYTAMGDTVNLASRLEGLNKDYGTRVMASDATRQAAGPGLLWRELDLVKVKGKETAVRVHELLGLEDAAPDGARELAALQDEALAHYRGRRFEDAAAVWRRVQQRWPDDGPARVMLARCDEYRRQPPVEGWAGEHVMDHK